MIKVIHGQLYSPDFSKLEQLSRDYSSCVRYCFNQFNKHNQLFNDVRRNAKTKYPTLNAAQVANACLEGQTQHSILKIKIKELKEKQIQIEKKLLNTKIHKKTRNKLNKKIKYIKQQINNPKVVFGNRINWNDLKKGKITKEQWKNIRDLKIYARGDKTRNGNQLIRIVDDKLRITIGNKKWSFYSLFIPDKYKQELNNLIKLGIAYNVRLIQQDETHWEVIIDYKYEPIPQVIDFTNGAIGIDINPDRIAIANMSNDGNLINTFSLIKGRLQHGSTNKRNYDIGCLVKQAIQYSKEQNKGIVFEDLFFKPEFDFNKKFNKMRFNFVYSKFIELLERKCLENGIAYKKVNPAYTSVIGQAKYRTLYGLNVHESAAYVIARRGLGFNEKISVNQVSSKLVKDILIRTLGGKYNKKRIHSWTLWKQVKTVLTGLRKNMLNLKEFDDKSINIKLIDYFRNVGENPTSETFLSELVKGSSDENHLGKRKIAL